MVQIIRVALPRKCVSTAVHALDYVFYHWKWIESKGFYKLSKKRQNNYNNTKTTYSKSKLEKQCLSLKKNSKG